MNHSPKCQDPIAQPAAPKAAALPTAPSRRRKQYKPIIKVLTLNLLKKVTLITCYLSNIELALLASDMGCSEALSLSIIAIGVFPAAFSASPYKIKIC